MIKNQVPLFLLASLTFCFLLVSASQRMRADGPEAERAGTNRTSSGPPKLFAPASLKFRLSEVHQAGSNNGPIRASALPLTSQRIWTGDLAQSSIATNRALGGFGELSGPQSVSLRSRTNIDQAELHNAQAMRQFQHKVEASFKANRLVPAPRLYPTLLEKLSNGQP